jgi:hypothetical protein
MVKRVLSLVKERSHCHVKCIELSVSGFSRKSMLKASLAIASSWPLGILCAGQEIQFLFVWSIWDGKMMQ